jgi:polysaccharide export outer membrane protein
MGRLRPILFFVFACLALALPLGGCAEAGSYVWFSDLPPEARSNEYLVGVGDLVTIRVLGHEEMTTRARVRGDGRLAVPMIGEVEAQGKRPEAIRTEIEARLKAYLVMPSVTFIVDETPPGSIAVLGEVMRPGVFPLDPNMRIAQAIALGGGINEFASRDRIFVVRTAPKAERIRFTYKALTRDEANAAAFPLRSGDIVVVE